MRGQFRNWRGVAATELDWGLLRWVSNSQETQSRQLTVINGDIFPGKGHDFHRHPDQEEVIFVIYGAIEQWIETEKQVLGAGDSVVIPPGMVHASFNFGRENAKILAILGPCVGEMGIEQIDVSDQEPWSRLGPPRRL